MKVCDKCRKPIEKGISCLDSELCEGCAAQIKDWIKKPIDKGFLGFFGGNR